MKVYNFEQNTPEWYKVRELKFTASNASTIMAMGAGVKTLIGEMLADYYSSGEYEEFSAKYTNSQMERGHKFEDKARTIYELETGNKVKQVGFVELDEYIGCSPDGLVGEDGLIEIKNPSDKVFLDQIETKKIKKEYLDQMQFQMFVTNRQWCDYFAFNPNFTPSFIKIRVERDPDKQMQIAEALKSAVAILKERKNKLDSYMKVA